MDENLTPTQRVWKRRRERWAAWKANNPNATPRQIDRRRSRDWSDAIRALVIESRVGDNLPANVGDK